MYFSSGNIFIQMEKDFHIPILPGSWTLIPFYRKAKIIAIPFFFPNRKSTDSLIFIRSKMSLSALYTKWRTIPFDFICSDKIKIA